VKRCHSLGLVSLGAQPSNSELIDMKCATFLLFFVVLSSAYKVDVIDVESWRYEYIKYNLTGDQPQVRLVF